MACYDNIIGLARQDCPCIESEPAEGFDTSNSGIYITDAPPFDALSGYEECGTGSIWEMLDQCRTEAINTFVADTNALLMRTFKGRRERFSGQIGEATGRETLTSSAQYAGIRIACNPMRGGNIKIRAIGTLFSASGTITLTIYNSKNEEVTSLELFVANGFHLNTLATPISLPTHIDFDSKHEYYLVYDYNASNKPKANKIDCGCGGFRPWYDLGNPMWQDAHPGSRAWANWMMVGGWTGDAVDEFDLSQSTTSTQMNGLALQLETGCDVGQVLCNGNLDFTNDPFALSMAFAIAHKSREALCARLLASTKINRLNLINREALLEFKREFNAKYAEHAQYIAQEAQLRQNDCLVCRDEMTIKTVLA